MRIAMFYHSLLSDWNHGNAHFLRGLVTELLHRGHDVAVHEPLDGWSRTNLLAAHPEAERDFRAHFPHLTSTLYNPADLHPRRIAAMCDRLIGSSDLVIAHEWNPPALLRALGALRRASSRFRLLFHDTHHRTVSDPQRLADSGLHDYDGVLAFGQTISRRYLNLGWTRAAWTWHEAADVRVFRPMPQIRHAADLVWIGNWGDEERTSELHEFLIEPVRRLRIRATVYGVRYPQSALDMLARANIRYGGYLPNHHVPQVFAQHRVAVHVPRRYYTRQLPGIPTIRVFEALAGGIPLVCAPWDDVEHLFSPGHDYLCARDGHEMTDQLASILAHPQQAAALAQHGRHTILDRHTCAHRVDQLLDIAAQLGIPQPTRPASAAPPTGARAHA
jgi:spore maturation protein CgeB